MSNDDYQRLEQQRLAQEQERRRVEQARVDREREASRIRDEQNEENRTRRREDVLRQYQAATAPPRRRSHGRWLRLPAARAPSSARPAGAVPPGSISARTGAAPERSRKGAGWRRRPALPAHSLEGVPTRGRARWPRARIWWAVAAGCATVTACDAPGISISRCACARSAMWCSSAHGRLRSSSPKRNHDGISFHSGRAPDGSTSASCVTGRCVTAMRAVCSAGTSAANCSWKRSRAM